MPSIVRLLDDNFPDNLPGHCPIEEALTVVLRLEVPEQLRAGEVRQRLGLAATDLAPPCLASPPQRVLGGGRAGLAPLGLLAVEAGPVVSTDLAGVSLQLGQLQHLLVNGMEDVRPQVRPPLHQLLLPLCRRHLVVSPG